MCLALHLAAEYVEQLGGDALLAQFVILQPELAKQLLGVVGDFQHIFFLHGEAPFTSDGLSAELFSASVSAACKHIAAVLGSHSLAEAVYLASVSLFGLVSS